MKIPCDKHVNCECDELALTNFSSEAPDRRLFLGRSFGLAYPPNITGGGGGGGTPGNGGCTSFGSSSIGLVDANRCADRSRQECEANEALNDSCQACRGTTGGGSGASFDWPNFFAVPAGGPAPPTNPCCDPDVPSECCCQSDQSDPNDPPPETPPNTPPDNPNRPRLFCNTPQSCSAQCPDSGVSYGSSIPPCTFYASSQIMADRMAYAAACADAEAHRICNNDAVGGGNRCLVFCKDSKVNHDIAGNTKSGENLTYELLNGTLPAGLTMNADGNIYGYPSAIGPSSFTVKLTDETGHSIESEMCIQIMDFTPADPPNADLCVPYTVTFAGAGGYSPYHYAITDGELPPGLSLDPTTGVLSGTPYQLGTYAFEVTVTDDTGVGCYKSMDISVVGLGNNAVTVTCPTDPSITATCPANRYQACGAYAGYTQGALDSLASQDAFNSLASRCPCTGFSLATFPATESHNFYSGNCHFDMYWILPTVAQNTIHIDAGNSYNLFSEVNTGEGNPVWNPGCVPDIGNIQKPLNGTYYFYSDVAHTRFLFSLYFHFNCP